MDIYTFLIISHIIGTVLGVGGATFAEIFYIRAVSRGVFDTRDKATLRVIYLVLRIGLVLAVLSGFGFLLLYRITGQEELLFDPKLWAKMTIVFILVANAVLLQMRKISMWLGSSLSLTSWYAALILGSWRDVPYSYMTLMAAYVAAIIIVAFILDYIKKQVSIKNEK